MSLFCPSSISGAYLNDQILTHPFYILKKKTTTQRCIRVFDDGGQFRIVNVQDVNDAAAIYTRVLHKFNVTDEMEKYSIFTISGETGDGMCCLSLSLSLLWSPKK